MTGFYQAQKKKKKPNQEIFGHGNLELIVTEHL